jgi:hypothetical protein
MAVLATFAVLLAPAIGADTSGDGWTPVSGAIGNSIEASSAFCRGYAPFSGIVIGPGSTNGKTGGSAPGEKFTLTATGVGIGTWRIVSDPTGATTLASGGVFPGTLTYTVPASPIPAGVGFYVDTYVGNGDTISGFCETNPPEIPALSGWSQLALVMLLGSLGFVAFRLRRQA